MDKLSLEDLETIVLKYMGANTIAKMYFSLRSKYIALKKLEPSFKIYCKDLKNPDSDSMIRCIVSWLVGNNKVEISSNDNPLTFEDIIFCD